jgi:hypothetical protein
LNVTQYLTGWICSAIQQNPIIAEKEQDMVTNQIHAVSSSLITRFVHLEQYTCILLFSNKNYGHSLQVMQFKFNFKLLCIGGGGVA